MGHPQGTCGHSHVHGGRVQGMGVLVSDRALVTCKCSVAALGQTLSCSVRPVAGSALAGLGALLYLGRVRCPFCGGKLRDDTSAAAQRTMDPRDVRRGRRRTDGVWSVVAQSQEDSGPPACPSPHTCRKSCISPESCSLSRVVTRWLPPATALRASTQSCSWGPTTPKSSAKGGSRLPPHLEAQCGELRLGGQCHPLHPTWAP